MNRALPFLWLFLFAACASRNDGFVDQTRSCGPGEEIGVEAGWESTGATDHLTGPQRTMLVRVSNNSTRERTVKYVRVDPLSLQREGGWEVEGGSRDGDKVIPEGEAATFEINMLSRRRVIEGRGVSGQRELDVAVTVSLDAEETVRCRFRVPLGF